MIRSAQLAADIEAAANQLLGLAGTAARGLELVDPKDSIELAAAAFVADNLQRALNAHMASQDTPAEVADHLLMTSADLARLVKN